jgi:hypothetical protein
VFKDLNGFLQFIDNAGIPPLRLSFAIDRSKRMPLQSISLPSDWQIPKLRHTDFFFREILPVSGFIFQRIIRLSRNIWHPALPFQVS